MSQHGARIDDIGAYIATFTPDEREQLATAERALDLALLLHQARAHRQLTQAAAARETGLHQQAVSRLERPNANPQLSTMQRYLDALGYEVDIALRDRATGEVLGSAPLPRTARLAGSMRAQLGSDTTRVQPA